MIDDDENTDDPKYLADTRTEDMLQVLNAIREAESIQDVKKLADDALRCLQVLNNAFAALYKDLIDDEPEDFDEEDYGYHLGGIITSDTDPDDDLGM